MPPGLQSRLGLVNSGVGGFDSHALPPLTPERDVSLQSTSDSRGDVSLRRYREGDEVAIVEAFNRIFEAIDPGFQPRSMEHWRWEFADNPSGFESWVAETDEGKIVGQYAALVQPVLLEGERATFLHGVDSMTDPAYRRSLAKGGLFARLGNTFLDHYGGAPPEKIPVIWGPPVPTAWRIGKTQIRYVLIRTQLKLVLEPQHLRAAATESSKTVVEEVQDFPVDTEELFTRAADGVGAIIVRNKERMDWRFFRHPERTYRVLCARRNGELVGYAVSTVGDFDGNKGETVLCDWLVPNGERGASAALVEAMAAEAVRSGAPNITAVLPDTAPAWLDLQESGFRARPTRYLVAARVYDPRYRERWLHRHFYYTLGDMDLI